MAMNFGNGTFNLETGVVRMATLSKLNLAASGYMLQAMNSSTASQLLINLITWTKAMSPESSLAQSKGDTRPEVQAAHE
jgi:hypothetical protein